MRRFASWPPVRAACALGARACEAGTRLRMCRSGGAWSCGRLSRTDRVEIDEVGLHSFPSSRPQAILALALVPVGARPLAAIMTATLAEQIVDVLVGDAICDGSEHDLVASDRAAAPIIPFESGGARIRVAINRDLARPRRLGSSE